MDSPHVARRPHNKTGKSSTCSLARCFGGGATAYCRLVLCFAFETRRQKFGPHFIFGRSPETSAFQISATIADPRTGRLCRTLFAIAKSVSRLSTDRTPLSYKTHVIGYCQSSQPNNLCERPALFGVHARCHRRSHQAT